MLDIEKKIEAYISKHRNKCYAIANWKNLKSKDFTVKDILRCICKASNGSMAEMENIVDHLVSKRNVYGRSHVDVDNDTDIIDIVRDSDGELKLRGYFPDAQLPLKGQHRRVKDTKVFRKSDGKVNKAHQKAEEKLYDIGKKVRELFPNVNNEFITLAMQAIKTYASTKKINADKVISGIKKGRYKIDVNLWRVVPKGFGENITRRTIVINEDDVRRLNEFYEMTEYKFHNHIRNFISKLLEDPVNAQPSELLKQHGCNRSRLLYNLLKQGIIIKSERISDKDENGEAKTATMMVKFKCPKKNFDRKIEKLYMRLFEKNLPPRKQYFNNNEINEDGEGGGAIGGATSASSSGQFIQPIGDVQRRKMPVEIEETTTTSSVGDYEYVVPFGGDKESLARKNGKGQSVSVNIA